MKPQLPDPCHAIVENNGSVASLPPQARHITLGEQVATAILAERATDRDAAWTPLVPKKRDHADPLKTEDHRGTSGSAHCTG